MSDNPAATAELVDAEIVHDDPPAQTRALVPAPRRSEVLRPLNVADQREAMELYQAGLREILDDSDWQKAGRDKFVKKSGWRKIAAWFDLSIELVRDDIERDGNGTVTRAAVCARAVAASGRFADGDGYCDATESRFADPKGRQKLENDLRGTAATRAINRAISNLVGMGAVSAEEVDAGGHDTDPQHPHGPPYQGGNPGAEAGAACALLADGNRDAAVALWTGLHQRFGYVPEAAVTALLAAAKLRESQGGNSS